MRGRKHGAERDVDNRVAAACSAAIARTRLQAKFKSSPPLSKEEGEIIEGIKSQQDFAQQLIDSLEYVSKDAASTNPTLVKEADQLIAELRHFTQNTNKLSIVADLATLVSLVQRVELMIYNATSSEEQQRPEKRPEISGEHSKMLAVFDRGSEFMALNAQASRGLFPTLSGQKLLETVELIAEAEEHHHQFPQLGTGTNDPEFDKIVSEFRLQDAHDEASRINKIITETSAATKAQLQRSLEENIATDNWPMVATIVASILGNFVIEKKWSDSHAWLKKYYEPHKSKIIEVDELSEAYGVFVCYARNNDQQATEEALRRTIELAKVSKIIPADGICIRTFYHYLSSAEMQPEDRVAGAQYVLESFAGIVPPALIEELSDMLNVEGAFAIASPVVHVETVQPEKTEETVESISIPNQAQSIDESEPTAPVGVDDKLDFLCEWNEQAFRAYCKRKAEEKDPTLFFKDADKSSQSSQSAQPIKWSYNGTTYDSSNQKSVKSDGGLFFAVDYRHLDPSIYPQVNTALAKGIVSGINNNGIIGDEEFFKLKLLGKYGNVRVVANAISVNKAGDKLHIFGLQTNHNGVDNFRANGQVKVVSDEEVAGISAWDSAQQICEGAAGHPLNHDDKVATTLVGEDE